MAKMKDLEIEELFQQIDLVFVESGTPPKEVDYKIIPVKKEGCPKCGARGEFVKMALVCKKHGFFAGC